jgi:hypothetical protein|nr:hypothetical protein [uncultured Mediterranean phage uvMED]
MIFDNSNLSPELQELLMNKLKKQFKDEKLTKTSKAKASQKKKKKE